MGCMATPVMAVEYTAASLRDPFQTGSEGSAKEDALIKKEWRVEGVVWNTDQPNAIVNGKIVRLGSRIENAEVIAIEKNGVRLKMREGELFIKKGGKENSQ